MALERGIVVQLRRHRTGSRALLTAGAHFLTVVLPGEGIEQKRRQLAVCFDTGSAHAVPRSEPPS